MGELFKATHTIDEYLDRLGVQIVLDGENLSEEDKREAEKNGDIVKTKNKKDKKAEDK
jgi:hypothetical protein